MFIYVKLKETIEDKLSLYTIVLRYILEFESTGKVLGIKNMQVVLYNKIGELLTDKYFIKTEIETIYIDLFYSKDDARTEKMINYLEKIKGEFKEGTLQIKLHDWDLLDGRRNGDKYRINKVPTIQIDEYQLVDPSEYQIRNAIMKSFASNVEATNERFNIID